MTKKYIDCKLESEILEILKFWNKKRKEDLRNNKNQCTRNPVYKVQKNTWAVGDANDFAKEEIMIDCETFLTLEQIKKGELDSYVEYHAPFEKDVESIKSYLKECDSLEEVLEMLEENEICIYQDEIVYSKKDWEDQAYFLTYEEAEDYARYQKHNLGESRIYVDAPGYANKGSFDKFLQILDEINIFGER
ncbi:MAG: hypothetical protein ACRCX2_35330 [Paraclostridium sp.]